MLEAEAIEEEVPAGAAEPEANVRPLPELRRTSAITQPGSEIRTVALAAAGGIVAGAATVAAIRVVRAGTSRNGKSVRKRRSDKPSNVLASRSFLVDVHLLGDK